MHIRFLGQSGFQIDIGSQHVVIDPFLTGNPNTDVRVDEVEADYVLLSHAHGDHYGDTPAIAAGNDAVVVSSAEVAGYVEARGMRSHGMNVGGGHDFPFGRLRFTPAWHSNSFTDGTYAGMPMGCVIEADGLRVYHAGDTALFSDMRLIGRGGIDLALLPIGDNFTMGPDDAIEAIRLLEPKQVIPMHYDTFDVIRQDAEAFKRRVESETDARCLVLRPGDAVDLAT